MNASPWLDGHTNVAQQKALVEIFGLRFDTSDVAETARRIAAPLTSSGSGARLFVTPNIQHIAEMRTNPGLRRALEEADLMTCDGFPVATYARMRGCEVPGRITGREVVTHLMLRTPLAPTHRLFFLLDSDETADAVRLWADASQLSRNVCIEVAPARFGEDEGHCADLARRISDFGATILFLGVGAPRSELFALNYRHSLPDCWALCIGQSVRIALGIAPPPPAAVEQLRLEWLWRVVLEPRRLIKRYVTGVLGFGAAVATDLTTNGFLRSSEAI